MIDFPTRKKRSADFPLLAFSVRSKNECALARAHQHSYLAHAALLSVFSPSHNCLERARLQPCRTASKNNCHPERRAIGRERRERLKEPEAEGSWFCFSVSRRWIIGHRLVLVS